MPVYETIQFTAVAVFAVALKKSPFSKSNFSPELYKKYVSVASIVNVLTTELTLLTESPLGTI